MEGIPYFQNGRKSSKSGMTIENKEQVREELCSPHRCSVKTKHTLDVPSALDAGKSLQFGRWAKQTASKRASPIQPFTLSQSNFSGHFEDYFSEISSHLIKFVF